MTHFEKFWDKNLQNADAIEIPEKFKMDVNKATS